MITKENFKKVLTLLGFNEERNVFSKHFSSGDFYLKADFNKGELIYPEEQNFTINERQTCNFNSSENFVVFECVHRLLDKGYKPEHIELEPKWKLGHGASGGRADIFVRNQENKPLLIIECKTAGREFDKAWKDTLQDGGQLFTYIEQEKDIEFACLYASDYDDKNSSVNVESRIISHKDNDKILAESTKLKGFKEAKNVKERYKVWRETYQLEFTEKGIFEENILPYQIGKDKYTLDIDTKAITATDIKGKYHQFRTILRKYNVSRRENAFEVLVNLFLCKLVDELENPDDLKFYWKGIAYDNYYDFVDRLQELYKIGMERFLEQEIMYVSNEEIDQIFWAIKQKRNATKQEIKKVFKKLKFFKGLDFEFIKVTNEATFAKNARILLEIIQMWQGLRLKTKEQNQFLGDMFEYFLDNGIKQSEGQFFTPVPICKFIVMSLPLESQIQAKNEPLNVIDYACGSGHFLTEYALQIKPLVKKYKQAEPNEYYKHIVGIEKEDRLAKVAKVSAFMYGRDEINVFDADALATNEHIKDESFDLLIANPPFAVEDFLMTLDEADREKYELFEFANDTGNKNIQCFFLERAKQLLAGNGTMGVIVPSSVLSNSDTMHIATREILLKYFDVVSIVELGSATFGKTGTNTVVLFLRRKPQRPEPAEHYQNRVLDFFENWEEERKTSGGAYLDVDTVQEYCRHINIPFDTYQSLLLGKPSDQLLATEMFSDYKADFDSSTEIKNLKEQRKFKAMKPAEQKKELAERFLEYLQSIEKEKLYYFMLAQSNPHNVLLVKSPADNKAQKQFLGYEWSGAKGSEGIRYNGGETVYEMDTLMFDPHNRTNDQKLNYYIQQNFEGKSIAIPEQLQPYVSTARLTDLLDFSRNEFNKSFSLSIKQRTSVESKWELVKIGDLAETSSGGTPLSSNKEYYENGNIPWINSGEVGQGEIYSSEKHITELGLKNSNAKIFPVNSVLLAMYGATAGKVGILKIEASTNQAVCAILPNNRYLPRFLFYQLDFMYEVLLELRTGIARDNLSQDKIKNLKIPLPPLEIQEQIVAECEAIDQAVSTAKATIDTAKNEIGSMFHNELTGNQNKLSISTLSSLLKRGKSTKYGSSKIQVIKSGQARGFLEFDFSERHFAVDGYKPDERMLRKGDLLINSTGVGTAGRVTMFDLEGLYVCDSHVTIFRPSDRILPKYALYCLAQIGFKTIESMAKGSTGQIELTLEIIGSIQLPVPPLSEQRALVEEVEKLEAQIASAKSVIESAPAQKQEVMKKWL